jgi:hypothetical protein
METTNTGILVGLLTEEQKEQLVGQQYAPDSYFNPIQDDNDNWIISIEEITASDLSWIKELTLIEYVAKKPIEPTPAPTELNTEDQIAEVVTEENTTEENSEL